MIVNIASRTNSSAARAAQTPLAKFEPLTVDGDFYICSAKAAVTFQTNMGLSATGVVDATTWQYLFGYNAYPNNGVSGGVSGFAAVNNYDYAGNAIMTSSQLALLSTYAPFYKRAQAAYGVPWQILAALHYREYSLQKSSPSDKNGPYQIWGRNYPIGAYSDEQFQAATNDAAQFILGKVGSRDLTVDDNVKYVFFAYNVIAQVYKIQAINLGFMSVQASNGEGFPYVMNRYDYIRDPTVQPTKSIRTRGQIKTDNGSILYPANSDYGTVVIYKALS